MRLATLALRGLLHHRAANVAVVLGVATAVAVLGGALLVGESLRGSLRDQVVSRLGRVDHAVASARYFRTALAGELQSSGLTAAAALAFPAVVDAPDSGRRAGAVDLWGVDQAFWALQGRPTPEIGAREVLVSEALARELGVAAGGNVVLRLRADEDVSGASIFGRRNDPARSLRLTVRAVLAGGTGDFSLRASQQPVKAAFVPLDLLQRTLGREGRANTLLITGHPGDAATVQSAVTAAAQLDDLGLQLRALPEQVVLQAEGAYVSDDAVRAARSPGLRASRSLVHLANTLRVGERTIPYSTIVGVEGDLFAGAAADVVPPLALNTWAAEQLAARVGDAVAIEYFVWLDAGRMDTRTATFRVHTIVPLEPDHRELVPRFPGLTEATHMADWEPPFPVDLSRIRPVDEQYWDQHRGTPKAFVPLDVAQRLFGHREGNVTSVRLERSDGTRADVAAVAHGLRIGLDVTKHGLRVDPVRARSLEAARGSTDFGEYFLYFSAFLVAAALLLAGLFFRLGVDQRLAEIGLLRAVGYPAATVRRLILTEAVVTSTLGAALGVALAPAWASVLLWGLRRFAGGTLGTGQLTLHLGVLPLLAGGAGGLVAAVLAAALTLRGLRHASPRALLKGDRQDSRAGPSNARRVLGWLLLGCAASLVAAAPLGVIGSTPAFFGAGLLTLAGIVVLLRQALGRGALTGTRSFLAPRHLGLRGPSFRPGRSAACVTLVAAATFMVVAVGAFRHGHGQDVRPRSAGGGFALLATSLAPIHHDPMTAEGRDALGLSADPSKGAQVHRFRMRGGDDASCLNLYAPQSPTVLAPSAAFLRAGRFSFKSSLAATPEEETNPWLLLERPSQDGVVPAIADAGSLQYILKKKLGDTMTLAGTGVTVRFVAALSPGLFQGELLVGEDAFRAAFPRESGHRFFLVDAQDPNAVSAALESALGDFGFDATPVPERLAAYHAVENTYIATFQMLGALGLLLGTIGVAAVMVRNALEQRRELALLSAVGFRRRDLGRMLAAETALVLALGLGAGTAAAALAVLPALAERDGTVPVGGVLLLLAAVAAGGLIATRAAVAAVTRLPLLQNLRSE